MTQGNANNFDNANNANNTNNANSFNNAPAEAIFDHFDTSEPSGPIPMSPSTLNIMCLIKDDESMVSSEYIEQIMELF